MKHTIRHWTIAGACCVAPLASTAAWANPDTAARTPTRDPMQAPADARPASSASSASAPAAEMPQARHLMVIDGRRFVVWGGRKRGVGEMLGDARIERIEDSAIVVRLDGTLQRLPLYGDVTRRPAIESPVTLKPPSGAGALPRPARPTDAVSMARPERPPRPDIRPDNRTDTRPDSLTRAGDPQ